MWVKAQEAFGGCLYNMDLCEMIDVEESSKGNKTGWRSRKRLPDLAKALTDEFQNFYESGMDVERYCDEVADTTGLRFKKFEEGKKFSIHGEVVL